MSGFSALAQGTAEGTIVSMAKGSQSADNPEFYVPAETAVKQEKLLLGRTTTQRYIPPRQERMQLPTADLIPALFRPVRVANL
jgi:hypothetical protein